GLGPGKLTAAELWAAIVEKVMNDPLKTWRPTLGVILRQGTLAERIIRALQQDYSRENTVSVYKRLASCLANDEMFTAQWSRWRRPPEVPAAGRAAFAGACRTIFPDTTC